MTIKSRVSPRLALDMVNNLCEGGNLIPIRIQVFVGG